MRIAPLLAVVVATLGCSLPEIPGRDDGPDITIRDDVFAPEDVPFTPDGQEPAFSVATVDPSRGPLTGGTRVEIRGTGFVQDARVVFGASDAVDVVVQNERSILATTPANQAGFAAVSVVRPDGVHARLDVGFFYEAEVAVTSVVPAAGPASGGTPVTIRGRGFATGTRFVIGGRPAFAVRVLDDRTALALTPPGEPGPRDVLAVSPFGRGTLRKGFAYATAPGVPACDPVVVAADRPSRIVLSGEGLADVDAIDALPGTALPEPADGDAPAFVLVPDGAGPVQVAVSAPGGRAVNPACAWAVDGIPGDGSVRVLGATPAHAPASGGVVRTLAVAGLAGVGADEITVTIGDAPAEVVALDGAAGALRVVVPAHAPGIAACRVQAPSGEDARADCLRYRVDLALAEASPASGPLAGGTRVRLTGTGLDRVAEVRIGPLPATIVAGPGATAIDVVTAPGSPGIHDVTVVTDQDERATLAGAFTYGALEADLLAVTPDQGALAGGTLVALVGSGFGPGTRVDFDGVPAEVADDSDPARLLVRTPRGMAVGRADVTVRFPTGYLRTLADAFAYFDPVGVFGGVWGETIAGAVNVTVLDGGTGRPVPSAFVMLGEADDGPYHGRTNDAGQLTLSGLDLFGPVQVTATREDYTAFTIAGIDAENVTVFIDSLVPTPSNGGGGGGGSNSLPPGLIQGRVLGADKNLLAPPEPCADRPLIHGALCRPCGLDAECGDGAWCVEVANAGFHCATACADDGDCPEGYACYGVSGVGSACMPSVGRVEIRCNTTLSSAFQFLPEQGPGALAGPDGSYVVNSRLGNVGVQCIGGVRRFSDGVFDPVVLGLERQVQVYPARITRNRDVRLDIPLNRDLEVTLLNVPGGPDGPNAHQLMVWMDLGPDGMLRLWPVQGGVDRDRFVVPRMPRAFTGALDGALLTFYAEANSQTADSLPYSVSRERDWIPGRDNAIARVRDGAGIVLSPDTRPDASAGCAVEGGALVFSPQGRTWFVAPDGQVRAMPSAATRAVRACAVDGAAVFAVGDAGLVVRLEGDAWVREAAATPRDLFTVAVASDGTAWAGGDGVLLRRGDDGTWTQVPYGALAPIRALLAAPGGGLLGFGDGGLVLAVMAGIATPVLPFPTGEDLRAAANVAGLAVVVGSGGSAFVGDWAGNLAPIPVPTWVDLRTVGTPGDATVLAGGSRGSLFRFADGAWTPIVVPGFSGEVTTLVPGTDGDMLALSADAVAVGPFLGIARYDAPLAGLPWASRTIAWRFDGPPDPSLAYMHLYGLKTSGNWVVIAPGAMRQLRLPDLRVQGGPNLGVLAPGPVRLRVYHILRDAFDIDRFDDTSLSSSGWRSWVVQQVDALWTP